MIHHEWMSSENTKFTRPITQLEEARTGTPILSEIGKWTWLTLVYRGREGGSWSPHLAEMVRRGGEGRKTFIWRRRRPPRPLSLSLTTLEK